MIAIKRAVKIAKITIKHSFQNIFQVKITIKHLFQKIFRWHHTNDLEIMNLDDHLAKILYAKIKAYKDTERYSYPFAFHEFERSIWKTKKAYNDDIKAGKIVGGGKEAWEKVLDSILYSLSSTANIINGSKGKSYNDLNYLEMYNKTDQVKLKKGYELLGKHFLDLWY